MKLRALSLTSVIVAAALCVTACGNADKTADITKIGLLAFSDIAESDFFNNDDKVEQKSGTFAKDYEYEQRTAVYYNSLSAMLTALKAGNIDYATMLDSTGDYVMKQNPNIRKIKLNDKDAFSMAVLSENAELLAELNDALSSLYSDGTLDSLAQTYLVPEPPKAPELAKTEGGKTITVALTGDMPPLDYIDSDEAASGYNIALLSAIAAKTGLNIELVSVDAGARVVALSSGKADIAFWVRSDVDSSNNTVTSVDAPQTVALTTPYRVESICMLYMEK